MIVLDTDVVSEMMRADADEHVQSWLDEQDVADLVITSITAAELRAGAAVLPHGRRRSDLGTRIDAVVRETFFGAVLAFEEASGPHYAEVIATRRVAGRLITPLDAQIAAICLQHEAALATRNARDFDLLRLSIVNPWIG